MNIKIPWILVLGVFLILYLEQVNCGKKRNEEIIVINNTGGQGCGGDAKTIVKTDGNKKKNSGHKIILIAGGGGKCHKKHHHTKVVHVPVPVPVPVPVKHEIHHEHQDHWGKQESHHDDHWASATSNEEMKRNSHKLKSGEMIKSASIPYHLGNFNVGSVIPRMEKQIDSKSNIIQALLVSSDKNMNNRTDKKTKQTSSNLKDNKKKNDSVKLETNAKPVNLVDTVSLQPQPMLAPAFMIETMPTIINPNFIPPIPLPTNQFTPPNPAQLAQQMNDHLHFQQQQQQQQQNQKLQEMHQHMQHQLEHQFNQHVHQMQQQKMQEQIHQQKLQEVISSTVPHQIPNNSPLAAQLPIPFPGQIISAPVFEPIIPPAKDQNKNNPHQQSQQSQQFLNNYNSMSHLTSYAGNNELEIVPYEIQQQLHQNSQNEKSNDLINEISKETSFHNLKEHQKNNVNQLNEELDAAFTNLIVSKDAPPVIDQLNTIHLNQQNQVMFPHQSNQMLHLLTNKQFHLQEPSSVNLPILVPSEQLSNGL